LILRITDEREIVIMALDFLRSLHGQIFILILYSVAVILVGFITRNKSSDPKTRKVVSWVIIILVAIGIAGFIYTATHMASVNLTPRKVIDRSDVNQQTDSFKERVDKSAQEGK
jgi:hypothetical protein